MTSATTTAVPARGPAPEPDADTQRTDPQVADTQPSDPQPEERIRRMLVDVAQPSGLAISLLMVGDHRSASPQIHDVPISASLAQQLLEQVVETATAAAESELRPLQAGFTPGPAQWVHGPVPDGALADLDAMVLRATHRQYDRTAQFGPRSLLVLRIRGTTTGADVARIYQGFAADPTLTRGRRILAFWNGEQFGALDDQPLVIDRALRLFVVDGTIVMKSNGAYESLFGALPTLRATAAATFDLTLGRLPIVGVDELRSACESDINMMRKLVSIAHRMDQPGYPEVDMPGVLAFLERNPHIAVPVDTSGESPALVFQSQAQLRWTLLKLLDDDFLRSDLTQINYEANSKSEVPR